MASMDDDRSVVSGGRETQHNDPAFEAFVKNIKRRWGFVGAEFNKAHLTFDFVFFVWNHQKSTGCV
jgi:hypothetical protein